MTLAPAAAAALIIAAIGATISSPSATPEKITLNK